jgi:hypothetical protein
MVEAGGGLRRGGGPVRYFRIAWAAVAALTAVVFVSGMPAEYARLRTPCEGDVACAWLPRLTAENTRQLGELGLSPDFFSAYFVAIEVAFTMMAFAIGAVILWRKPEDRMALLVSLMLITFGAAFFVPYPVLDLSLVWKFLAATVSFIGSALLVLFLYIFPDGRFVPRWTRWAAAVWIAGFVLANFFYDSVVVLLEFPLFIVLFAGAFVGVTGYAQIYRYLRVSGPEQRQQTRWVVFGIVTALGGLCALVVLDIIVPGGVVASLFGSTALFGLAFLIPLSIGIAILRYRLFDIDVIINRTLVYGLLSATLVGVYVGSVISLQYVLQPLTGEGSQLAIVASTLLIAALFSPLRRRIQNVIDLRFYRKKYDAAKTLDELSARLRDETDLGALSNDILMVVRDTMQPEHVSLWLRETERRRTV